MPNRVIKESINDSFGLSECSIFAQDLYKRLITYADDYGRFNSDTMIMRARLYAREYESISEEDIIEGLIEIAGVGKIQFYTSSYFNQGYNRTGVYGVFPNWKEHQRVRETKAKCPKPDDLGINDWYLRRFIPIDMKAQIVERDGFKCKICGKFVTTCRDAKRFVKLGSGMFHIDHIVPVVQGGRATLENLQLTCPECNLKKKKRFTFKEILAFSNDQNDSQNISPQVAASCGELPPESNPNPNPNPIQEDTRAFCEAVTTFLNQKANTAYRASSKKTRELILARKNEGFTLDDFKTVIAKKAAEWGKEPEKGQKDMRPYLRPETLFGTKFESYLNQPVGKGRNTPKSSQSYDLEEFERYSLQFTPDIDDGGDSE